MNTVWQVKHYAVLGAMLIAVWTPLAHAQDVSPENAKALAQQQQADKKEILAAIDKLATKIPPTDHVIADQVARLAQGLREAHAQVMRSMFAKACKHARGRLRTTIDAANKVAAVCEW